MLAACALAGALALFALRCGHATGPGVVTAPPRSTQRHPRAAHPAGAAPVTATSPSPTDGGALVASPGSDPSRRAAANAVSRMLRVTDDADRALLSEIERRTRSAPPPAVHELIALRRSGAPRVELERLIGTRLGGAIALRLAALRWLNAVAPRSGADAARDAGAVPPAFGKGGGARRMQGIEQR
jgi:hypothetical protein